jgi:hypothetical protein
MGVPPRGGPVFCRERGPYPARIPRAGSTPLGSRNDEDRSEFRYVMRIAELVNHQSVERKLHFL